MRCIQGAERRAKGGSRGSGGGSRGVCSGVQSGQWRECWVHGVKGVDSKEEVWLGKENPGEERGRVGGQSDPNLSCETRGSVCSKGLHRDSRGDKGAAGEAAREDPSRCGQDSSLRLLTLSISLN